MVVRTCTWRSPRSSCSMPCSFTAFHGTRLGQRRWRRCHGRNLGELSSLARQSHRDNKRAGNGIQGTLEIAARRCRRKSRKRFRFPTRIRRTKIKPAPVKSATQRKPEPEPEESNQIPYGEGGPVSGPYTMTAGGAKGGFGFTGSGGDFGSRFSWYVQAVQRKVTENWLKYEVDPRITEAKRVYLTFDIARDGHPSQCPDRAVQRRAVARPIGRAGDSAH